MVETEHNRIARDSREEATVVQAPPAQRRECNTGAQGGTQAGDKIIITAGKSRTS